MSKKKAQSSVLIKFFAAIVLLLVGVLKMIFVGLPTIISRPFKTKNAKLGAKIATQLVLFVGIFLFFKTYVFATAVSWDGGAGTSNWSDANNWSNNIVPTSSDDVTIDSNVTVNIATGTTIHSLTLGNSGGTSSPTLNFSYDAIGTSAPLIITGGDLTVYTNATITHSAGTTVVVGTVNINVTSGNATITGTINANSKGFAGVLTGTVGNAGNGTGGGGTATSNGAGGAGHGGTGGSPSLGGATGGTVYGSYYSPVTYGSSGGEDGYTGGGQRTSAAGGGAIQLTVSGTTSVAGSIDSNGATAGNDGSGGGAGGSVNLTTGTISGSGSITANGGSAASGTYSGSGGGGRIAIKYSVSNIFYGSGSGAGTLTATAGSTGYSLGENGTVIVVDTQNNDLYINKSQTWRVKNSAGTTTEGSSFTYRNVYVGNQSASTWTLKGYNSNNSDGVGQSFYVANFTLSSGSVITGNGGGYASATSGNAGAGPGGGATASSNGAGGGGHGGAGGTALSGAAGGTSNDTMSAPVELGSSGGTDNAVAGRSSGAGGDALLINASGKVTINGSITMNGSNGATDSAGAGAGGSVYFRAGIFSGSGSITANGGNAFSTTYSGGGAGGRVAVYRTLNEYIGTFTATGGTGKNSGGTGTVFLGNLPSLVWHFDEGTGSTAQDSTVLNNSGTLSNSPTYDPITNSGDNKFSLKLNGSNQYVSRSYSSDQELDPSTDSFAVASWFKHSSTISGTDMLIARYTSGGYKIYMNSSGYLCFAIDDDSSWTPDDSVCGTTSLADATWHHVEGVKTSTTSIALYIDGILVASKSGLTATGSLSGSSPTFYVGIDTDASSNPWDGNVDEVNFYPGARTASQLKDDYIKYSSLKNSDPGTAYQSTLSALGTVGYWKFDDSSWTQNCSTYGISDSSGNSNPAKPCPANANAPASGQTGKYSNGLVLNGTGYAQVASSATIQGMSSFTISAWIKPTQCSGPGGAGYDGMLVRKKNVYSLSLSDACNLALYISVDGTNWSTRKTSTGTVSTGTWNHIAVIYDGSKYYFYINGSLSGSGSTSVSGAIGTNSEVLYLGSAQELSATNYNFVGTMDEVKIYNRVASQPEITQLYNNYYQIKPLGYWNFENGQGTTLTDMSGNGSSGTYNGTGKVHWTSGKYGKGGLFNGSDDSVTISNETYFDFDKTQTFSLGAWVKPNITRSGGEAFYSVLSKLDSNTPYSGWELNLDWNQASLTNKTTAKFRLVNTNTTNNIEVNGSTDLANGNWYYIFVTYDGTSASTGVKMYVNGTLETLTTVYNNLSASTLNTISPSIGSRNNAAVFFNGSIDEVRIYNYVRTQKQIIEDMNGGHPAGGSPVGSMADYWRFDDGFGTTTIDSGPQSITGTLTNMSSPASVGISGWNPSGKYGKAISFDGSNDYVDLGDLSYTESATQLTWSFWVNPNSLAVTKCLFCKYNNAATQRSWAIATGTSNSSAIRVTIPTSTTEADGTTFGETSAGVLSVGSWAHVVVVYDGTATGNANRLVVYVNGKNRSLSFTGTIPASTQATTSNGVIGASSDNSRNFSGSIDEVKIYSSSLTASEVLVDYNHNQSIQNGSFSISSTGVGSSSASAIYCPPGDSSTCLPPVGEWNFEEGQGTSVSDTSGNGNNGTWNGTLGSQWVTGKIGKGGNFIDSDSNYVSVANTYWNADSSTVEMWVYPTQNTIDQYILDSNPGGNQFTLIWYPTNGSYNGFAGRISGAGSNWAVSSQVASLNTWHYLVLTSNGSSMKLYIDGKLESSVPWESSYSPTDFNLGSNNTGAANFTGKIDNVKFWNYERTPSEVAWGFSNSKPAGWWRMDDCLGSTAVDSSGNNHPATITIGASGSQTSATNCNSASGTDAWSNGKTGKFNYSLNLDGTDDYLTTSAFSPLAAASVSTTSVSWGGWFYPTTSVASKTLLEKATEFQLTTDASSKPVCGIYYSGAFHNANSGAVALSLNSWNHVVCVYDGTNIKTYVNGGLVDSTANSNAITAASSSLYFGETSGGANFYKGQIDEVKVWNYPLSSYQIKIDYNQGSAYRTGP